MATGWQGMTNPPNYDGSRILIVFCVSKGKKRIPQFVAQKLVQDSNSQSHSCRSIALTLIVIKVYRTDVTPVPTILT